MDADRVSRLLQNSSRFVSPFSEPYGYYIWTPVQNSGVEERWVEVYWRQLSYAVEHADALILQAVEAVCRNPELVGRMDNFSIDMHQKLRFESFVLDPEQEGIGCCLSSPEIMAGHFIDCWWDLDWHLISWFYC